MTIRIHLAILAFARVVFGEGGAAGAAVDLAAGELTILGAMMKRFMMNWPRWIGALMWASGIAGQVIAAPADVRVKPGDRVVFLGDSATGQHGYSASVADYFALCHPELHLSFRTSSSNAIWRVADGTVNALPNVLADAIDVHPAVVIVSFGADDAGHGGFGERQLSYFSERLGRIVRDLKHHDIAVILMTPADLSPDGVAPADPWYGRVIDDIRDIAAKEQIPLLDLNSAMRTLQSRLKESNQPPVALTHGTGLAPAGHELATFLILRSLGVNAGPAAVEIDAKTRKTDAHRCKIDGLAITADQLRFSRMDEALPLDSPAEVKSIVKLLPIGELNRYGLKVRGLKPGTWKLKVEDRECGSFTAGQLAAGVDLSDAPGPWRAVAQSVHEKTVAIENAFNVRCHYGSEPKIPAGAEPQRRDLVASLDAGIEKLAMEQAAIVSASRTWTWTLSLEKPK